jgi:large subunit ribosomal protein L23
MSQERLMNVLLEPHISEKSSVVADQNNQVVFKVAVDATKDEIKKAVELMFEVGVDSVRVMNMKGKVKRTASGLGRRKNWKKAYVSLKEGQDISFIGAE